MTNLRFAESVLQPDPERRALILPVLDVALTAADPATAMHKAFVRYHEHLYIGDSTYDLDNYENIFVIGFGKAATPMAEATVQILGGRLDSGLIVTKYGHGPEKGVSLGPIAVLEAGHPMPDEAGRRAAKGCSSVRQAGENDLVICLISVADLPCSHCLLRASV